MEDDISSSLSGHAGSPAQDLQSLAASAGAPKQQATDSSFTMKKFMDIMHMCQSQLQSSQQPMATVPPPKAEATAPKTREVPSTVSQSTALPEFSDSGRKSQNRRRRHRGRHSWKSRSPYDFESSLESSSTSVSDLRSMIGVRDPLRLEVRDGGRRVSLESRGEKRSHSEQGSGRRDQQRYRSLAHRSTSSRRSRWRGRRTRRGSSMEEGSEMTLTLSHLGIPCLGMQ